MKKLLTFLLLAAVVVSACTPGVKPEGGTAQGGAETGGETAGEIEQGGREGDKAGVHGRE